MSKRIGKLEKQLSVVNWKSSISNQSFNRQPITDNPQLTSDNRQPTPSPISRKYIRIYSVLKTDNPQPTTDIRQPTTDTIPN
jgi:hypothetical protein